MDRVIGNPVDVLAHFSKNLLVGTTITSDGILIGCDQAIADALGYQPDEMINRPASDFVVSDYRDELVDRIKRHNTEWYDIDLLSKSEEVIPAVVIPEEMNLNGKGVRTAVLLHRGPIMATETSLINSLRNSIAALTKAIESRDPYTAGHQTRVAEIAVMIGRELTLDDETLHHIEMAAMMHDIGKISIPAEILVKPARLTEGEWALIRTHPVVGEEILANIDCAPQIKRMVRSHHERMDGSGYPDGLTGNQMPVCVRILGVADVMDAIAGVRPYHAPRTMQDALEIIESYESAYDKEVVSVIRYLLKEGLLVDREFTGFSSS